MRDEQELRNALQAAVPEAPPIEFAPRRRHLPTPVLAALLVLAAMAIPLGILLPQGDERTGAGGPSPEPPALACPAADTQPPVPEGGTLPAGAVAARLCALDFPFPEPPDELTSGLEDLVSWINAREVLPEDRMCTMDLGRSFRVVFGYADGRTLSVTGQEYGCHVIQVGDTARAGASDLWAKVVEILRAQRAVNPVASTGEARPPACTDRHQDPGASPVAMPWELNGARLCVRGPQRQVTRDLVLTPAQLDAVRSGLRRDDANTYRCTTPIPHFTLIGRTTRGEVVSLNHRACFQVVSSAGGEVWRPDIAGMAVLRDLLGLPEN